MIDIKIHEDTVSTVNEFLVSNEQFGDDWREEKTGLNDLLAEVKQLRKELDAAEDVIQYALDRVGNDDDAKKVFEDFLEVIE